LLLASRKVTVPAFPFPIQEPSGYPPLCPSKTSKRRLPASTTELALLETLDMGKPIRDSSQIDIPRSAQCIRWYAEAIDKLYDEIAPSAGTSRPTRCTIHGAEGDLDQHRRLIALRHGRGGKAGDRFRVATVGRCGASSYSANA
jgi:hypothetical protein